MTSHELAFRYADSLMLALCLFLIDNQDHIFVAAALDWCGIFTTALVKPANQAMCLAPSWAAHESAPSARLFETLHLSPQPREIGPYCGCGEAYRRLEAKLSFASSSVGPRRHHHTCAMHCWRPLSPSIRVVRTFAAWMTRLWCIHITIVACRPQVVPLPPFGHRFLCFGRGAVVFTFLLCFAVLIVLVACAACSILRYILLLDSGPCLSFLLDLRHSWSCCLCISFSHPLLVALSTVGSRP